MNWFRVIFIAITRIAFPDEKEEQKKCMDVKLRKTPDLCTGENDFLTKRKKVVFKNIRTKFGHLSEDEEEGAPNIAIIGSGGGIRAVIGMCGAMTALHKNGILDCTLYTAGVSGSAWYLMALYANDKQHSPKELNDIIQHRVNDFRYSTILDIFVRHHIAVIFNALFTTHKDLVLEITNPFGEMIEQLLLEQHSCDQWYKLKPKLKDGSVPLPLLAALHVRSKKKIKDYNEWIEFSPYEMYIPRYCAAIDMEKFGNKFYGGFSKRQHSKSSIQHLIGICGSGFTKVREWIPEENKWYMIGGINYLSGFVFDFVDASYVAKVPNWLLGITELEQIGTSSDRNADVIEQEKMMLVDAGISFNSPYPSVLHPSRKIDLILSFDFSARRESDWPFGQLEKAEKWARQNNVPFPKIYPQLFWVKKEWKKGNYKEMYVFPGDNSPTIVHFVAINKSYRKSYRADGVEHDFDIFPRYGTFRFYYSEQDFNKLRLLVQHNVGRNTKKINRTIQNVIKQKQKRKQELEGREKNPLKQSRQKGNCIIS